MLFKILSQEIRNTVYGSINFKSSLADVVVNSSGGFLIIENKKKGKIYEYGGIIQKTDNPLSLTENAAKLLFAFDYYLMTLFNSFFRDDRFEIAFAPDCIHSTRLISEQAWGIIVMPLTELPMGFYIEENEEQFDVYFTFQLIKKS